MAERSTTWRRAVLFIVMGWAAAVQATPLAAVEDTRAHDARVGGDATRTRFIADLSKDAPFSVRILPDPYRVIIDLPDVRFQMPPGVGARGRGLITAFRYGNFAKGKSRIVIDLSGPARVEKAFTRPPEEGQPARLVVDLVGVSREEFMKAFDEQARQEAAQSKGWEAKEAAAEDSAAAPPPQAAPDKRWSAGRGEKPLIVIDPGHGGIDPGTSGASGAQEKTVVLAFCLELKTHLESTGRFRVVMTRETDVFVPLAERVRLARDGGGDLLISIHADAIDAKHPLLGASGPKLAQKVRGASIYTLDQQASDAEAQASAARENLSDVAAGLENKAEVADEVTSILVDLVQRATKNESREFSNILMSHLSGKTKLNVKPQRYANFTVLRAPDVPSVLIELGYLSNAEDEALLNSPEWRRKVALGMTEAVKAFFENAQARLPF